MGRLRLPLLALCLAASIRPSGALAITFQPTTTADGVDALINGICATADGECTLRAAIQEANATLLVEDKIDLSDGKYTLKLTGAGEDNAASGDLDILADLVIQGKGASERDVIIAGKKDRVFEIFASAHVVIENLTIAKGKLISKEDGGGGSDFEGGGINNHGDLTLNGVIVSGNKASDDGGGINTKGGSILSLNGVTVTKNSSREDGGGINVGLADVSLTNVTLSKNKSGEEGGGLQNVNGNVELTNVTVSGNKAKEGGGGLHNEGSSLATLNLTNVTLKGNKAKVEAGGVASDATLPYTLVNTLLDKNKPLNCFGPIADAGENLETLATCGFVANRSNVKKLGLKGLKENEGPTDTPTATHALKDDSPAIDAGVDGPCPPTDQRGVARVDVPGVGTATCDSGSFEFQPEP